MPTVYLLDIEGTTTPIDFVTRTLFPYARQRLAAFPLSPDDQALLREERAADAAYKGPDDDVAYLYFLMDEDRKSTALKSIQGKIWAQGYAAGELQGEVYPDVIPAIRRWRAGGARVYIYSSGSVLAQKLIFGHLPEGGILDLLDGHFDTNVGPKREAASYERIAKEIGVDSGQVCFYSDIQAEVDAAEAAGMQTRLIARAAGDTF